MAISLQTKHCKRYARHDKVPRQSVQRLNYELGDRGSFLGTGNAFLCWLPRLDRLWRPRSVLCTRYMGQRWLHLRLTTHLHPLPRSKQKVELYLRSPHTQRLIITGENFPLLLPQTFSRRDVVLSGFDAVQTYSRGRRFGGTLRLNLRG